MAPRPAAATEGRPAEAQGRRRLQGDPRRYRRQPEGHPHHRAGGGATGARLDDFDLAQGYPHYLRLAGTIDPTRALLFDGIDNREYVIQFVTRGDYQDRDGRLARFVDIYQHSPVVRAALDKAHGTLYQPGWE